MKDLYRRLSEVGITRAYVRTALPDWWDDELARNPAGYAQGLLLLSRHLGLDLGSLQDENATVRFRDFGACKYKRNRDVSAEDLALGRAIATRVAQLAAEAVGEPFVGLPAGAAEMRRKRKEKERGRESIPE
jgi:hypothetical protein